MGYHIDDWFADYIDPKRDYEEFKNKLKEQGDARQLARFGQFIWDLLEIKGDGDPYNGLQEMFFDVADCEGDNSFHVIRNRGTTHVVGEPLPGQSYTFRNRDDVTSSADE